MYKEGKGERDTHIHTYTTQTHTHRQNSSWSIIGGNELIPGPRVFLESTTSDVGTNKDDTVKPRV